MMGKCNQIGIETISAIRTARLPLVVILVVRGVNSFPRDVLLPQPDSQTAASQFLAVCEDSVTESARGNMTSAMRH